MSAAHPPPLRALAATELTGAHPPALPAGGWEDRFDAVVHHGLAPFLARAWTRERVELDEATQSQLERRLEAEAVLTVRLEAELIRLAPLLDRCDAVVLKGPVLAHHAYPDPAWRPFSDLDVLVPAPRMDELLDGLADHGYRRPRPDPTPGFASRVAKATVVRHPSGLLVDVHRTLAAGPAGARVDVDAIIGASGHVDVGCARVRAPAWPHHLVQVALHAAVGDGLSRLRSIRDVAQVAALAGEGSSGEATIATARRWGVERYLAAALRAAEAELGAALPAPLVGWLHGPARAPVDARTRRAPARDALSRLQRLRHGGARRHLTLVRAALAPTPEFLRWRYGAQPLLALYQRRWHDVRIRALSDRSSNGTRGS